MEKRIIMTFKFVTESDFKYVLCDLEGNIEGCGFSRAGLVRSLEEGKMVLTVRQYAQRFPDKV